MCISFDREHKKQNYEWVEVTKDVKSQSQERIKEEKDIVKELLNVPPGGYGSSGERQPLWCDISVSQKLWSVIIRPFIFYFAVLSWDGRPNELDTALKQSQEAERRRRNSGDSWDKDLDKGKV